MGSIECTYQKIHTFDVDIKGGPRLQESLSAEPGNVIVPPVSSSIGKVGLAICYDLRFPEVALRLRRQGAEILTYPSAFTVRTGSAHWELLLRSTAVQTQSYVVAAAQVGRHDLEGKRQTYGHSMVISWIISRF
jgi:deaminated glutathione amidase